MATVAFLLLTCVAANAQASIDFESVVACYRLKVVDSDPQRELLESLFLVEHDFLFADMPRHFRVVYNKKWGNPFMPEPLDVEPWPFTTWEWGPGRVEIGWATGFVSYDLVLTGSDNILSGRAKWFSDDGSGEVVQDVEVRRVACDTTEQNKVKTINPEMQRKRRKQRILRTVSREVRS